jgi:hypothetical protein
MRSTAFALMLVGSCALVTPVCAQTWTSPRGRPPLWQIISIDRSGEQDWRWGAEDIAKDGAGRYDADEASSDLRTVYADSDRERLWLRAYVGSAQPPLAKLLLFAFVDVDGRADTGTGADAIQLRPEFASDPSQGGFERAIGVGADGRIVGAWRWDSASKRWISLESEIDDSDAGAFGDAIAVEVGRDRDPVALAGLEHGYIQLSALHALSGLNASCAAKIFVRTWLDDAPRRSFGDEVASEASCRAQFDASGNPAVLDAASCDAKRACPAAGSCRNGACVIEYDCDANADCRSGQHCEAKVCVAGSADDGSSGFAPGKVRGGAFHCALSEAGGGNGPVRASGLLVLLVWLRRISTRRRSR